MAAHRYWRLLLMSSTYPAVAEVEFHSSIGGSDETGSGTAICGTFYDSASAASKAFDNDTATFWKSLATSHIDWIGYDFGAGNDKDIVEVSLTNQPSFDYAINDYDLQYSDNGTDWVTKYYWRDLPHFTGNGQTRVTDTSDQPSGDFVASVNLMYQSSYPPVVVTDSSHYSTYGGFSALTSSLNIYWISNDGAATGWIKYDFGAGNAIQIDSYDLVMPATDTIGRAPKNWTLLGSNNNSDWDTIDTETNQTSWSLSQSRTFTIDSPNVYRYYKLNVTANNGGGNYIILGYWKLHATLAAPAYSLAATSGSFLESGTAATLRATRILTVGSGSFAESGTAASLEYGRKIAAASGEFLESGTAAGLRATRLLSAASGSFAETGSAATLTYEQAGIIYADPGSFSLTGAIAALKYDRKLSAAGGAFGETGTAAGLRHNRKIAAQPGAYTLSGTAIDFLYGRVLPVGSGAFVLTGTSATLIYVHLNQYLLDAGSGTFLISGGDVSFLARHPGASRICYIFRKRRDHFRI